MSGTQVRVSAGIIRNRRGEILICRRGEGRRNAHLWEFPGGKWEAGETAEACLVRELQEELSLPVEGLRLLCERETDGIRFSFLEGTTEALPQRTEHEAVCFVRPRAMLDYPFCPADTPVARALALRDPPLRALIWDFDGTLFDTYPHASRALAGACRRFGAEVSPGEALALMKDTLSSALSVLAERHAIPLEQLARAYREEDGRLGPADWPPMPGMREALLALRDAGCRHFLLTHRDAGALEALEAAGMLPLLSGWVTREQGFPRKPDPASVLHILRHWDIPPETACIIGDRPLDVQAGQAAGILGCLFDPEGFFDTQPFPLRAASPGALTALLLGRPD